MPKQASALPFWMDRQSGQPGSIHGRSVQAHLLLDNVARQSLWFVSAILRFQQQDLTPTRRQYSEASLLKICQRDPLFTASIVLRSDTANNGCFTETGESSESGGAS